MFLSSIIKVSELLVEREPGEYEFAHLSFQAFLAAGRVKEQNQETLLLQHFEESWWRETILLYAAQANPTNLLREACKRGTSGAVSLAYDCLRELPKEKREKISPTIEAELKSLEPRLQDLRYRDLENFLKHGQWQKADEETYRLMIKIVGKEEGQWFDPEDLYNFPCEDLQQIDWLWVKYSNGKFGFSIQKKIYLDCGGIPDGKYYDEAWKTFCDRVGWRNEEGYIRYSDVTFNTSAPVGHLPDFLVCTVVGGGVGGSLALALRLEQCNL
jgi:predicted NACHT family NTPase